MNSRFPLIAAIAACAAVFFLMVRIQRLETALHKAQAKSTGVATQNTPDVAEYMGRIQVLANKLWSAGKAGNLPLAGFYRHELKEQMETIAGAHIMDDGVDVSEEMTTYGIRTMDAMKEQLATNGLKDFDAQYASLISTCNSCHTACGKPYLVMKVPTYTRFDDQEFMPVPP